ncbi:MAG TPA: hypothetical protein VMW91_04555, partial [Desulfosporosinus sp.]|nr:hypothetical protein [Desulfosporosinus sp.]
TTVAPSKNAVYDQMQLKLTGSYADAAEIIAGTEAAKAIAPDQLKAAGLDLGAWTTPAYSAGDYTAGGSMTWTVEAGDANVFKYTIIGKIMIVTFSIITTTVGGTPDQNLNIKIPASKTATNYTWYFCFGVDNNARTEIRFRVNGTNIEIYRNDGSNWAASTNLTSVYGTIIFEIN